MAQICRRLDGIPLAIELAAYERDLAAARARLGAAAFAAAEAAGRAMGLGQAVGVALAEHGAFGEGRG